MTNQPSSDPDDTSKLDELYMQIGQALSRGVMQSEPTDPEELVYRGRSWFESQRESLRKAICRPDVYARMNKLEADEAKLALAVADAIAALYAIVPVLTIATIVVRIGVARFCAVTDFKAAAS